MSYHNTNDVIQYGVNDQLNFGKYRFQFVGDVIQSDPKYIAWCLETIDYFDLDDEAQSEFDMYHDEEANYEGF